MSQTDGAGNVGHSAQLTFDLEPAAPTLTLGLADDTSGGQDVTNDTTVVGNAGDATSVTLTLTPSGEGYADAPITVTLTPGANGDYSYTPAAFAVPGGDVNGQDFEVPISVTAVATDAAGNISTTQTLDFIQKDEGSYLSFATAAGATASYGPTVDGDEVYVIGGPGTITVSDSVRNRRDGHGHRAR